MKTFRPTAASKAPGILSSLKTLKAPRELKLVLKGPPVESAQTVLRARRKFRDIRS